MLEGEMDDMIQRFTRGAVEAALPQKLPVGVTFMRSTGQSEQVVDLCLALLKEFNRPLYNEVVSSYDEEMEAYKAVKAGADDVNLSEILDSFAYETLTRSLVHMSLTVTGDAGQH
jgi:hypothetical protein